MSSLRLAMRLSLEAGLSSKEVAPALLPKKKKKRKQQSSEAAISRKKVVRLEEEVVKPTPKMKKTTPYSEKKEEEALRADREAARCAAADALIAIDWESWSFECSCGKRGNNFDDGRDMIQCMSCFRWAHDDCVVKSLKGHPKAQKLGALRMQRYKCFLCDSNRYRKKQNGASLDVMAVPLGETEIAKEEDKTRTHKLPAGVALRVRSEAKFGDKAILREVCERGCYERPSFGFEIVPGETWLDIGAHVGSFSSIALTNGADVIAVEPFASSFSLLRENGHRHAHHAGNTFIGIHAAVVPKMTESVPLFLHPTGTAFRHSAHASRLNKKIPWAQVQVPAITMVELLERHPEISGVKIDIQGCERAAIDSVRDWKNVTKLVFEYDFEYAPSILQFHSFIYRLKSHFPYIWHPRLRKTGLFVGFPNGVLVFAMRSHAAEDLPEAIKDECDRRFTTERHHLDRLVRAEVTTAFKAHLNRAFPSSCGGPSAGEEEAAGEIKKPEEEESSLFSVDDDSMLS